MSSERQAVSTARGDGARRTGTVGPEYAELVAFFDRFAEQDARWRRRNSAYHTWISQLHRFQISSGARVLEIGSGSGDLLASLSPAVGVGVDVSEEMVARASQRHPELRFERTAGEHLELGETFDYVVLSTCSRTSTTSWRCSIASARTATRHRGS